MFMTIDGKREAADDATGALVPVTPKEKNPTVD